MGKSGNSFHFLVQPIGPRPDYRLVLDFLWPPGHAIDTDGDSHNPASRTWTFLMASNVTLGERFEVWPVHAEPFTWGVVTMSIPLEARVAYFLASEADGVVIDVDAGERHEPEWLREFMGNFDLAAAEKRAETSIWRRSTLENPYPDQSHRH